MRRLIAWCWLLGWLGGLVTLPGQGADQQYVGIYAAIQEGDRLLAAGQERAALAKYLEAQTALQRLQSAFPDWNPRVVRFRLNYLAERIAAASGRTGPAPVPETAKPTPGPEVSPTTVRADPALLQELEVLRQQVAQLQSDKALLEARLREALSVQPAAADPRELARAQNRIRDLEKELELLRVALDQERQRKMPPDRSAEVEQLRRELEATRRELEEQKELARRLARDKASAEEQLTAHSLAAAQELQRTRQRIAELEQELVELRKGAASPPVSGTGSADAAALETLRRELEQAQQRLAEQRERADTLAREKAQLAARLEASSAAAVNSQELELLRQGLEEAQRRLAEQQALNRQLAAEKATLEARMQQWQADAGTLAALRAENALLKQQLAALNATPAPDTNTLQALQQAQARLATLQSDLEILRLEKMALEQRLQAARSNELAATRAQAETVANLQARLAALEAQPVPFTPEELALLRVPAPRPQEVAVAEAGSGPGPARSAPVSVAKPEGSAETGVAPPPASQVEAWIAQARRAFAEGQYEQAVRLYQSVLETDPRRGSVLADLALVKLEMGDVAGAEGHALAAVEAAPELALARFALGQVRFRQARYDEAVEALSRAAALDPRSAEVQNFLGLALAHKGLRQAAETALRRAILLQPGYAVAHHNLAVFYLHRTPPLVELARWHYQRARAGGHPPNPELESALAARTGGPSS
ncbi:MAG: tetratricopeptide repeat protein [Limisphaera sp.]